MGKLKKVAFLIEGDSKFIYVYNKFLVAVAKKAIILDQHIEGETLVIDYVNKVGNVKGHMVLNDVGPDIVKKSKKELPCFR